MSDRSGWTAEQWAMHRRQLNRRLRASFLAGAEERSLAARGRGLTNAELAALLREYSGDLATEIVPERD